MTQRIDKIRHLIMLSFLIGCMMIKWARLVNVMKCRSLLEKKQLHAFHNSFFEDSCIGYYGTNCDELPIPLVTLSVSVE
jgi:hypothetical protein